MAASVMLIQIVHLCFLLLSRPRPVLRVLFPGCFSPSMTHYSLTRIARGTLQTSSRLLSLLLIMTVITQVFSTPFLTGALIRLILSSSLFSSNLSSTLNLFTEKFKVPYHESGNVSSRTSSCSSPQKIAIPFESRNAVRLNGSHEQTRIRRANWQGFGATW